MSAVGKALGTDLGRWLGGNCFLSVGYDVWNVPAKYGKMRPHLAFEDLPMLD